MKKTLTRSVERVDMEPADALRLIMSAGLGQRRKQAAVPEKSQQSEA